MTENRAEINLEVSTGFFRISTENLVYNITVLGGSTGESAAVAAAAQSAARQPAAAPLPPMDFSGPGDDFYKQVSNDIYHEIGNLAKSLSSTLQDLPAEDRKMERASLDDAGEKIEAAKDQLRDIVAMTEQATMQIMDHVEKVQNQTDDVRDLLAQLKDHKAFLQEQLEEESQGGENGPDSAALADKLEQLEQKLNQAEEVLAGLDGDGSVATEAGEGDGANEGAETNEGAEAEETELEEASAAVEQPAEPQADEESEEPAEAAAAAGGEVRRRFLFQLDIVFQTIYELCTNETVKGHISTAREKAAELFDYDAFVDAISPGVAELEADEDGFYTVPLTNVLQALAASCTEKKIKNLFVKMEANQGEIFIDSALPLEVPDIEEIREAGGAADEAGDEAGDEAAAAEGEEEAMAEQAEVTADETGALVEHTAPASGTPSGGGDAALEAEVAPARQVLAEALAMVAELRQEIVNIGPSKGACGMTREDQLDVFHKVENAFSVASNIYEDVTKITEALSFQDLSGQQILKIIKLLSDFQVQLLAIVVSFGSQLKSKEKNATITPEESKRLAQGDVDRYLKTMTGDQEAEGPLDQDTVNKMLEDFGF